MGLLGNGLGWPHLLIILAIVLLLFGAPKLPGLAKSIGQSMRIFKGEMKSMKEDGSSPSDNDPSATPQDDDAARSTSDDATSETTNTTHTKPPSNS